MFWKKYQWAVSGSTYHERSFPPLSSAGCVGSSAAQEVFHGG